MTLFDRTSSPGRIPRAPSIGLNVRPQGSKSGLGGREVGPVDRPARAAWAPAENRHPWSMLVVVVGVLGVPMTLVNEVGVVAVLHVRVATAGPVLMWVGPGIDVR